MEQGDIYRVSLDPTSGHEQQGIRPVLIISPGAFNRVTRTPIIAPITTGGHFARTHGFTVSLNGAGMQTVGLVLCHQLRAIDVRSRDGRRIETAPREVIEQVLAKIATFLG